MAKKTAKGPKGGPMKIEEAPPKEMKSKGAGAKMAKGKKGGKGC